MTMKLYTGGTFDLFHSGHVNFLKRCRAIVGKDGRVVVSLNTDEFINKYKGKLPVCTYAERKAVLEACKYVDEVICNESGEDSKTAILKVMPDYLAVGSDWATKDYYKQMSFTQAWLDANGIALIYIPYTKGISSTEIKKKL